MKRMTTAPTPIRPNVETGFGALLDREIDGIRALIESLAARVSELENRPGERWPALMPASKAAEYLGISLSTLYRLVSDGHIRPTIPYGMREQYYRREELDRWRMTDSA